MNDAPRLSELTFDELTTRLASSDPVPGGGSASALAGALAASLVSMVAELTKDDGAAELGSSARERITELTDLAQEDAEAYAAVVAARRLPKGTDAERDARRAALRSAMAGAATAPLRIAQVSAAVLDLAERLAPIGNPNAASDIGVAGELAATAVRGAALNVRINLPYLAADEPLRATLPEEVRALEERAGRQQDHVAAIVAERMEPA